MTSTDSESSLAWWWRLAPRIIAVLWVALNGWFYVTDPPDRAIPNLIFLSSTILLGLALALCLLMQMPRQWHLKGLGLGAALFALLPLLFRVDGWSGAMQPNRIVFRWAQTEDYALEAAATSVSASTPLPAAPADARDFPQFLGPTRNNVVTGVSLAREWTTAPPELVWRQPIGAGWSGFVVAGGLAVTQEQRGDQETITCYELATGKLRWVHANHVRFESVLGANGPRATPAIVAGKVYAIGATGILDCVDLATGRPGWSRDLIQESGAQIENWGKSASPLVVDNLVIASAGGPSGKSLFAFDQETGKPAWHAGDDVSSYATPALATLGGVRQVLVVNQDYLVGHDLTTGRVLWRTKWDGKTDSNANTSQAIGVADDRVFVSKGYSVGGRLLQVRRTNDQWDATTIWPEAGSGRTVLKTKLSNVALRNGMIYGLDDGILQCVELATGRPLWKKGRFGHGQLVLADDLLLVSTEMTGEIALVEATPESYRELGRLRALSPSKAWNHLCLAGRYLLVRHAKEAACYRLP